MKHPGVAPALYGVLTCLAAAASVTIVSYYMAIVAVAYGLLAVASAIERRPPRVSYQFTATQPDLYRAALSALETLNERKTKP